MMMYRAVVTRTSGVVEHGPVVAESELDAEVVRLTKSLCLALDEMEALRSTARACKITTGYSVKSVHFERVPAPEPAPAPVADKPVTLTYVELHLTVDTAFPRTAVARHVKALGGSYEQVRGYNNYGRRVTFPLTNREAATRVLGELLKLPRHKRTSDVDVRGIPAIISTGADFAHEHAAFYEDRAKVGPRDGETAAQLLERAERIIRQRADDLVAKGKHGWTTDPETSRMQHAAAVAQARRFVVNAREQLAQAEARLADLLSKAGDAVKNETIDDPCPSGTPSDPSHRCGNVKYECVACGTCLTPDRCSECRRELYPEQMHHDETRCADCSGRYS